MEDIMIKLEKAVKYAVGTKYEVNFCETRKNNGVVLKSLSICKQGKNTAYQIHIDGMLEMIASGKMETSEAAGLIVKYCREKEQEAENLERMTRGLRKSEIFQRVTCQVVNKMSNAEMLMGVPYKTVLDMALVFRVMLQESEYGTASFLVSHALCDYYSISFEELYSAAVVNMACEGFMTHTIESVLAEMGTLPGQTFASECPMLIITNRRRLYGAAVMAYPAYFKRLSEKTGSDLYILPSSIHEVIVVPDTGADPGELRKMVMEVNASGLDKEEFLSDNVYRYSRKAGGITIV